MGDAEGSARRVNNKLQKKQNGHIYKEYGRLQKSK